MSTLLLVSVSSVAPVLADKQQKNYTSGRGFFITLLDDAISCVHYMVCPFCLINPERQEQKFYDAIETNRPGDIEHLICRRCHDPNGPIRNQLPLVLAAKKGHVEAIGKLIEMGADVNFQPSEHYPSSLIAVCATENLDSDRVKKAVSLLLRLGADPTLSCRYCTDSERKLIEKAEEALAKNNEILAEQLMHYLPRNVFDKRSALDFAKKNNYVEAYQLIRAALSTYVKKNSSNNAPKKRDINDDEDLY